MPSWSTNFSGEGLGSSPNGPFRSYGERFGWIWATRPTSSSKIGSCWSSNPSKVSRPSIRSKLLTYLKLTNIRLGLLINFGAELIKDGVHRVVNGLPD